MKSLFNRLAGVAVVGVVLYSCASIGRPEGGAIDETPPRFVGSTPAPGALNNNRKKITIEFDEFIKLEKPGEKIVISPPQVQRTIQVNAENKSVAEVLNKVFEGTNIYYAMEGKNIMLMSRTKENQSANQTNKVTGVVKDTNGETIIGANVTVKGQSIGTITDIDGRFVIDAPANAVLQITYIGYIAQEVKYWK